MFILVLIGDVDEMSAVVYPTKDAAIAAAKETDGIEYSVAGPFLITTNGEDDANVKYINVEDDEDDDD